MRYILLILFIAFGFAGSAERSSYSNENLTSNSDDIFAYLKEIYNWNKTNEIKDEWHRNVYVLSLTKRVFNKSGNAYVYDAATMGTTYFNELNTELAEMNKSLASAGFSHRVYVAYDPELGELLLRKTFTHENLYNQYLDENGVGKYVTNTYQINQIVNEFGRLFQVFGNIPGEAHIFGIANIKARASLTANQSYSRLLCLNTCGIYKNGVLQKTESESLLKRLPKLPTLGGMAPSKIDIFNALYEGARILVDYSSNNKVVPAAKKKGKYERKEPFSHAIDKAGLAQGKGLTQKHYTKRSQIPQVNDPSKGFKDYTNETSSTQEQQLEQGFDQMQSSGGLYPEVYVTNDNTPEDVLQQIDQLKGSTPAPKKIVFEFHYNADGSISVSLNYSTAQLTPLQIKCLQKLDEKLPGVAKTMRNRVVETFPELAQLSLELINWLNGIKGNTIPEKYYNPLAPDYDDRYSVIFASMLQGPVASLGIDFTVDKSNPSGMAFAFSCGFYNGFVEDVGSAIADLPFIILLIAIDEDFRSEMWNGIKQLSLSKVLQMVKEDFDGDAYQNSHMAGRYIFNIASLFFGLGEAKAFSQFSSAVTKMKQAFSFIKNAPDIIYRFLKKKSTSLITMGVKIIEVADGIVIQSQNLWKIWIKGDGVFYDQLSPAFVYSANAIRTPIYRASDNFRLYMRAADGTNSPSSLRGLDIVDNQDGSAKLVSLADDAAALLERAQKILSDAGRTEMQFDNLIKTKVSTLLEPQNASFLQKIGGEDGLKKILNANKKARCSTCPTPGDLHLKFMDEYLEDLRYLVSEFSDKPGIEKIINAAKSGNLKDIDAVAHHIRILKENLGQKFVKENIEGFDDLIDDLSEVTEVVGIADEIIQEFAQASNKCRFDIKFKTTVTNGVSHYKYAELKSYLETSISVAGGGMAKSKRLQKQLTAYFKKIESLDDLDYIFDWRKLVADPNVPSAFAEAQGKLNIIKTQFKEMFISKADEWFNADSGLGQNRLLNLFGTQSKSDFLNRINDLNNSIYRFIKIQ